MVHNRQTVAVVKQTHFIYKHIFVCQGKLSENLCNHVFSQGFAISQSIARYHFLFTTPDPLLAVSPFFPLKALH